MKLSKNLSLAEVTKSQTATRKGIDNQPGEKELDNLKRVALEVFQPCRDHARGPLYVSSGYRSPELNEEIGGSKSSSHMKGEALDIDCDVFEVGTNAELFYFIDANLEFDQLIWEFGDDENPAWVHVSKRAKNNRMEKLRAVRDEKGKVTYQKLS